MLRKIIFCLILLAAFPVFAQERVTVQTDEAITAWREDLARLESAMQEIHPNLYWRFPQTVFQQAFAELDAQIPTLTDEQIKTGIIRLGALVDGHSFVDPFQPAIGFHLFPLQLYLFADGLYVIDADAAYAHLIGGRVATIGELSAEDALDRLRPVVNSENEMSVRFGLPLFAIIPEVLRAQELTPSYTIELPDGERLSIAPEAQTLRDYLRWHPVPHWLISLRPRPEPLPMRHTDENFWYTYLATEDALYLQFNHVSGRTQSGQNLTQFVQAVTAEYEARSPQQVVVDVRHNLGGDNSTYGPLLDWLSTVPTRIHVIIGRYTFSAAVNFLVELELRDADVRYVGEPTGSGPRVYATARTITLPNSRIAVAISARDDTIAAPGDERRWIEPDVLVEPTAADFFAGVDAALAAIFAETT